MPLGNRFPASFVTVQSPLAGFGNGTVNYTAALNQYTYSGQTATITVNGGALTAGANVFTVNEAAGSCTAPVFGTSMVNIAGAGGIHDVSVGLPSNCAWNVSNNLPWITLSNSVDSEGSGTLSIYAAPNSYSQRQGTITLATMPISIVQTGGSCSLSLPHRRPSVPAQITGGAVSFTTGGTCAWGRTRMFRGFKSIRIRRPGRVVVLYPLWWLGIRERRLGLDRC